MGETLCHGKTNSRSKTSSKRARGELNSRGMPELGVSGSECAFGTQGFQVLKFNAHSRKIELEILSQ